MTIDVRLITWSNDPFTDVKGRGQMYCVGGQGLRLIGWDLSRAVVSRSVEPESRAAHDGCASGHSTESLKVVKELVHYLKSVNIRCMKASVIPRSHWSQHRSRIGRLRLRHTYERIFPLFVWLCCSVSLIFAVECRQCVFPTCLAFFRFLTLSFPIILVIILGQIAKFQSA